MVVQRQESVFYDHFCLSISPFCLVAPCARSARVHRAVASTDKVIVGRRFGWGRKERQ